MANDGDRVVQASVVCFGVFMVAVWRVRSLGCVMCALYTIDIRQKHQLPLAVELSGAICSVQTSSVSPSGPYLPSSVSPTVQYKAPRRPSRQLLTLQSTPSPHPPHPPRPPQQSPHHQKSAQLPSKADSYSANSSLSLHDNLAQTIHHNVFDLPNPCPSVHPARLPFLVHARTVVQPRQHLRFPEHE